MYGRRITIILKLRETKKLKEYIEQKTVGEPFQHFPVP